MEQVTFTFYQEHYQGTAIADQAEFGSLEPAARGFVDKVCFDRAKGGEGEKMAVCACCEVLLRYRGREGIASEHNDGYIVTYDENQPLYAALWLAAWPYLSAEQCYRGVDVLC